MTDEEVINKLADALEENFDVTRDEAIGDAASILGSLRGRGYDIVCKGE